MPVMLEFQFSVTNVTSGVCCSRSVSFLPETTHLQGTIEDVSYSCGATVDDLILPDTLKNVGIKSQIYSDLIEMIYYSAYKDDDFMCIHCGSPNDLTVPVDSTH